MRKQSRKKLVLNRETLRDLEDTGLAAAKGALSVTCRNISNCQPCTTSECGTNQTC